MRELLRKHGKIIMTVVSIALMFVFALPTFRNQTPLSRATSAYGYINGKKITNDDVANARAELQVLRDLGFIEADAGGHTWIERFSGDDAQAGIYWILICAEASKYTSVNVGPDEAAKASAARLGSDETEVDRRLSTHTTNRKVLALLVSRLEMVYAYQNFLANMPRPVSAMELEADRMLRQVQINYVPVDATQGWDKIPAASITADQIAAQFAAYKDVLATPIPGPSSPPVFLGYDQDDVGEYALVGYPGSVDAALHIRVKDTIPWDGTKVEQFMHRGETIGVSNGQMVNAPLDALIVSGGGRTVVTQIPRGYDLHDHEPAPYPAEINGHHYPFGYKFPDRVKAEYFKFERAAVRSRVQPTEADVAAAFKEFKAKPYKFRPEMAAATAPATNVSVAAPGATQPAATQATQPTTRSAQEILADWDDAKVRDPYINEQLDLRVTTLLKKMVEAARNKTDVPWKTAATVERANWLDYQKVAEDVARDPNFAGYKAQIGDTGKAFLGATELQDLPGIGRSVYCTTQGYVFDFPTMAANIEELVTPDKRQPLGRLGLQLGHEAPEVTDKDGNVYLFRVTEFQKTHVPASLDDENTRAKVIDDCRKLKTYEQQVTEIKASLAKNDDLDALAKQYHSQVQKPKEFNRDENAASVDVQFIRDFMKAAFSIPEPAAGKPPSVAALENDQWLRVYPMKLLRVLPATGADFGAERTYLFRQTDPAVMTFVQDYLQIERLAERVKFVPVNPLAKRSTTP